MLFWVKVNMPYDWKSVITQEMWDTFRYTWPYGDCADKPLPETPDRVYFSSLAQRVSDKELQVMLTTGMTIEVCPPPGTMITKMQDRAAWENQIPMQDALRTAQAVNIAIPDNCLLKIRTVIVQEDACTDTLQDLLNAGWRILAVCPPNAARRPDYILGHTETEPRRY